MSIDVRTFAAQIRAKYPKEFELVQAIDVIHQLTDRIDALVAEVEDLKKQLAPTEEEPAEAEDG